MAFERKEVLTPEETWRKLVAIGVLRKPELVQRAVKMPAAEDALPLDAEVE